MLSYLKTMALYQINGSYYGKNISTIPKTTVFYRKQWNFDLPWEDYGQWKNKLYMVLYRKL